MTVKPSGKRGVTSVARKRAQPASLTRLRPNSRSATTQGFCAPLHCSAGCAPRRRKARDQRQQTDGSRPRAQDVYPLTRSIAAPQAPSLSSSRSKPRSR